MLGKRKALQKVRTKMGSLHAKYNFCMRYRTPMMDIFAAQHQEAAKEVIQIAYSLDVIDLAQWSKMTWKINYWGKKFGRKYLFLPS